MLCDLNGEEIQGRRDICIHVFNSPCCVTETNKTMEGNYTPMGKKSLFSKCFTFISINFLEEIVLRKMFMCSMVSSFKCMYSGEICTLCGWSGSILIVINCAGSMYLDVMWCDENRTLSLWSFSPKPIVSV